MSKKPTGRFYKGLGEIYDGEQSLARVQCDLTEYEQVYTVQEIGSRQSSQGRSGEKEVRGSITVMSGSELLDSSVASLTLRFESGFSPISIALENGRMGQDGHWTYTLVQAVGNGFDATQ